MEPPLPCAAPATAGLAAVLQLRAPKQPIVDEEIAAFEIIPASQDVEDDEDEVDNEAGPMPQFVLGFDSSDAKPDVAMPQLHAHVTNTSTSSDDRLRVLKLQQKLQHQRNTLAFDVEGSRGQHAAADDDCEYDDEAGSDPPPTFQLLVQPQAAVTKSTGLAEMTATLFASQLPRKQQAMGPAVVGKRVPHVDTSGAVSTNALVDNMEPESDPDCGSPPPLDAAALMLVAPPVHSSVPVVAHQATLQSLHPAQTSDRMEAQCNFGFMQAQAVQRTQQQHEQLHPSPVLRHHRHHQQKQQEQHLGEVQNPQHSLLHGASMSRLSLPAARNVNNNLPDAEIHTTSPVGPPADTPAAHVRPAQTAVSMSASARRRSPASRRVTLAPLYSDRELMRAALSKDSGALSSSDESEGGYDDSTFDFMPSQDRPRPDGWKERQERRRLRLAARQRTTLTDMQALPLSTSTPTMPNGLEGSMGSASSSVPLQQDVMAAAELVTGKPAPSASRPPWKPLRPHQPSTPAASPASTTSPSAVSAGGASKTVAVSAPGFAFNKPAPPHSLAHFTSSATMVPDLTNPCSTANHNSMRQLSPRVRMLANPTPSSSSSAPVAVATAIRSKDVAPHLTTPMDALPCSMFKRKQSYAGQQHSLRAADQIPQQHSNLGGDFQWSCKTDTFPGQATSSMQKAGLAESKSSSKRQRSNRSADCWLNTESHLGEQGVGHPSSGAQLHGQTESSGVGQPFSDTADTRPGIRSAAGTTGALGSAMQYEPNVNNEYDAIEDSDTEPTRPAHWRQTAPLHAGSSQLPHAMDSGGAVRCARPSLPTPPSHSNTGIVFVGSHSANLTCTVHGTNALVATPPPPLKLLAAGANNISCSTSACGHTAINSSGCPFGDVSRQHARCEDAGAWSYSEHETVADMNPDQDGNWVQQEGEVNHGDWGRHQQQQQQGWHQQPSDCSHDGWHNGGHERETMHHQQTHQQQPHREAQQAYPPHSAPQYHQQEPRLQQQRLQQQQSLQAPHDRSWVEKQCVDLVTLEDTVPASRPAAATAGVGPMWELLEDFVPVEALKGGTDPRNGLQSHIHYDLQFTSRSVAAHQKSSRQVASRGIAASGQEAVDSGFAEEVLAASRSSRKPRQRRSSQGDGAGTSGGGGRWLHGDGGQKIYIDAEGQQHTGSKAYAVYKGIGKSAMPRKNSGKRTFKKRAGGRKRK